ncbi:MAG TPA: hypothetical protein VD833_19270 [Vicinamibacterales bacterium]|nr:hypothetical protein [Vicinamibacterales bacterium]
MDANITQAIGLSDDDTSDLLRKYYGFFHTLNPAQQDVVRRCMPSFDEAAAAIGQGTSAGDVQKFVASRLGGGAAQAVPVPTTSSAAQGVPVPTAQSAAGVPVPVNRSK